jgi:hypothetical protein
MAELDDVVNAINSLKNSLEKERTGTAAKTADELDLENKMLAQRSRLLLEQLAAEEDLEKKAQLKIERNQLIQEQVKRSNKTNERKAELIKDLEKRQKKLTKTTEKAVEAEQEHADAVDSVTGALQTLTGVSGDFERTLIGQTKSILTNTKAQEKLKKKLKETYTAANTLEAAGSKIFQFAAFQAKDMFSEIDQGLVTFSKATGMTENFGTELFAAAQGLRRYGVTIGDVGNALTSLSQAIPLTRLKTSEEEIAGQFALYEKFGVSVQSSATAFSDLVQSLGRTEEQSLGTIQNIAALGIELGVGAGKLTEDFAQALPRLAIYGDQAEKVFRDVAISSSALGLSVDDVMGLAEGFQTFESSAQAAGKLNAILGGGFVDNLALMEASFEDPAKAAEMIKSAFDSAGMSVREMGPAALKASAQAAGFNDVNKFRRFLEGDMSAAKALQDNAENLQLKANNVAIKSQTIMENIQNNTKDLLLSAIPASKVQKTLDDMKGGLAGSSPLVGGLAMGAGLLGLQGAQSLAIRGGAKLLRGTKGLLSGSKAVTPKMTNFTNFAKVPKGTEKLASPLVKSSAKTAAKAGLGKGLGKTLLKKIPGVGLLMGLGFMASRLSDGDFLGAGMELTSGLASTVPGAGTAASLGIDAALMARDMNKTDSSMPQPQVKAGQSGATISQNVKEVKHVIEIVQNTPQAEQFVTAIYRKDLSSNVVG